ncbi:MAG: hypothetical protein ACRCYU_17535 [Nocardioides sp.]
MGLAQTWRGRLATLAGLGVLVGPVSIQPAAAAEPIVNLTPPSVVGSARFRETLTAVPGVWTPSGLSFSYQWLRAGTPIPGADRASYRLGVADIGQPISARVTASDGIEAAVAASTETGAVTKARLTNRAVPVISGRPRYSRWLQADRGRWSSRPTDFRYQWLRGRKPIRGAVDARYRLRFRDVGKRVRVQVTARRAGYR